MSANAKNLKRIIYLECWHGRQQPCQRQQSCVLQVCHHRREATSACCDASL